MFGIDLEDQQRTGWGGAAVFVDGKAYYECQHMHGSLLRVTDAADVEERLEEAVALYRTRQDTVEYERAKQVVNDTLDAWDAMPVEERSAQAFLHAFESAVDPGDAAVSRLLLHRRVQKTRYYWASFVFEFVWLAGLLWLALWPVIFRRPVWRLALHCSFIPLLLIMPVYLGYARITFTTHGPGGGVLYPWVVPWATMWFNGVNNFDRAVMSALPQILEPLSQDTGPFMAISGRGIMGPTRAVIVGLFIAAAVLLPYGVLALTGRARRNSVAEP